MECRNPFKYTGLYVIARVALLQITYYPWETNAAVRQKQKYYAYAALHIMLYF